MTDGINNTRISYSRSSDNDEHGSIGGIKDFSNHEELVSLFQQMDNGTWSVGEVNVSKDNGKYYTGVAGYETVHTGNANDISQDTISAYDTIIQASGYTLDNETGLYTRVNEDSSIDYMRMVSDGNGDLRVVQTSRNADGSKATTTQYNVDNTFTIDEA
ncbi:MAG: hypothetical protein LUG16_00755 [Candidatus Gastranaerophilales bacterium]|nr:hypothetical protein [Candidatus Gastranaerophilales bacterium]